jgi:hypothetical protein
MLLYGKKAMTRYRTKAGTTKKKKILIIYIQKMILTLLEEIPTQNVMNADRD